jgi:hypothetical protein
MLSQDRFGATVTSETYVIDSTGIIRYHASIDDSQNVARVTTRRLALALDAVWRDVVVVLPPSTGRMPAMKTFRTGRDGFGPGNKYITSTIGVILWWIALRRPAFVRRCSRLARVATRLTTTSLNGPHLPK